MAFLTQILRSLCCRCDEPAARELRNRNGRISGVYCEKHAGAALRTLHKQEIEGTFAVNGDGRIGVGDVAPTQASPAVLLPAARVDGDREQAA